MTSSTGQRAITVAAALAVGAAAGVWVWSGKMAAFGGNARLVSVSRTSDSAGFRATLRRYEVIGNEASVLESIRKEAPIRIEQETTLQGKTFRTVTIPRIREGRAVVSFPPARRLTLTEEGDLFVADYHPPGALQSVVEWVRNVLGA